MTRTVLVTGGAGFIGSHVVEHALAKGFRVRVLDNLSTGSEANLAHLKGDVTLHRADVRDTESLGSVFEGVDTVFHLAAFISVPGSVADPRTADAINIGGTLNVLLAARDTGVRRVVFSSSAAVYGEPQELPLTESALTKPGSPYGLEKLYGEHMCRLFTELYGLETVSLRYFNVYGPRQNPASEYAAVVPKFIQAMLSGKRAIIYGDGQQTRDFLFVEEVARANLLAADAPGAVGHALNVASGAGISVEELHRVIQGLVGHKLDAVHADPRPGDIRHSVASVRLAEQLLGFRASVSLEEGLTRTVASLRSAGA